MLEHRTSASNVLSSILPLLQYRWYKNKIKNKTKPNLGLCLKCILQPYLAAFIIKK